MLLKISEKIFTDYPEYFCGVVIAENINNKNSNPEINQLIREQEKITKQKYPDTETMGEKPEFASWRQVYKKIGAKKYRASHEAITRRVIQANSIPSINSVVDIYNYISLKYSAPVGGEDIDTLVGDLVLDYATGEEEFIPLGQTENDSPKPSEVVYKDDQGVICRRWNWREGDRTKLTEKTTNAVIAIDCLPPLSLEIAQTALQEMANLIKKYCGGKVEINLIKK